MNKKPSDYALPKIHSAMYRTASGLSDGKSKVSAIPARSSKSYAELFEIGIDGWCYGIEHYPGEIYPELVLIIIREMAEDIANAVRAGVVIDLVNLGQRFSKAAKFLIHEKDIAFEILANLPSPTVLDEEGQFVLAQIVDKAELAYGGVLERMERRWSSERRLAA